MPRHRASVHSLTPAHQTPPRPSRRHFLIGTAGCLLVALSGAEAQAPPDVFHWSFDQDPIEGPPIEWEPQAGTWVVRPEGEGQTNRVLVQTGPSFPGLEMPVILTPILPVLDLKASLRFQRSGGGATETMALVLRWRDASTMTLVTVEGASGRLWVERLRAGARDLRFGAMVAIPPRQWHRLDVTAVGERIEVSLDGRSVGTGSDPDPLQGRIGLAARAGAGMLLDDLEVIPLAAPIPSG
jgi:hypothetical protein